MAVQFLSLLLLIVTAASSKEQLEKDIASEFSLFKARYARSYGNAEVERQRFTIFRQNYISTFDLQAANPLAQFGLNAFSDLTDAEWARTHVAYSHTPRNRTVLDADKFARNVTLAAAATGAIDWRDHGAVTPVKQQGDCGGCWAFSAIGNIEGQWAIKNALKKAVPLSEQQLISCDDYFPCMGCSSGEQACGWEFLKSEKHGHVATEASYPYASGKNKVPRCAGSGTDGATITGYKDLPADEDQMAAWCAANGPIAVAAYALPWKQYTGGIMTGGCDGDLDHAVLIVGFGSDKGQDYWIIKNSWGSGWGEKGYIRIARGSNLCKIKTQPNTCTV